MSKNNLVVIKKILSNYFSGLNLEKEENTSEYSNLNNLVMASVWNDSYGHSRNVSLLWENLFRKIL